MASQPVKGIIRKVKPLLSTETDECRRRVIRLYKAWYREIPRTILSSGVSLTVSEGRQKLREEFMKHKDVKDIRVIDMLIIKGHLELKEIVNGWKLPCHVMYLIKDTAEPRPKDFLSKFMAGVD